MAAPVIRADTPPAVTTGAVTSPSSTQVGDLLVFFCWSQGTTPPTHTLQSGFFEWLSHTHDDGTTDGRLTIAVKSASSSGAQSYTPYTYSGATSGQINVGLRVYQAGTWRPSLTSVAPTKASVTGTTNGAPNPPAVTSLTGDFQVLAIGCWHVTTAASTQATVMANYSLNGAPGFQNANASHVTHLAVAYRDLLGLIGASEDPAGWSDNVTPNGTVAATVAVPSVLTHTSGSLDVSSASALDIGSSDRTAFCGSLSIDGPSSIACDGEITSGGPTEHFSGSLDVASASSSDVTSSVRSTFGAADVSCSSSVTITSVSRSTFSALSLSCDSSISSVPVRTTFGDLSAYVLGSITADGSVGQGATEHFSGSLAVDSAADLAIEISVRTAISAASISVVTGLTVSGTSRTTFGATSLLGEGFVWAAYLDEDWDSVTVDLGDNVLAMTLSDPQISVTYSYSVGPFIICPDDCLSATLNDDPVSVVYGV